MPELPEVETVVRGLKKTITGQKISKVEIYTAKIRTAVPASLDKKIEKLTVEKLSRRAKYILIHLSDKSVLVIHLGMSGRIHIGKDRKSYELKKHDHMIVTFKDHSFFVFNDPRRFGLILHLPEDRLNLHPAFKRLGPEPLDRQFTGKTIEQKFSNRKIDVKVALMDQRNVVGVGNIYASEALFDAGISPLVPANTVKGAKASKLCDSVQKVLTAAIKSGGSTLKDYRQTDGELGYFQHHFAVYNREGKACANCTCNVAKTGGVLKITQGGRSTFYCPRKQK